MRVSFDFDRTLSREDIQGLAQKFVDLGAEVWIVTARPDVIQGVRLENAEVYEVAGGLGIPPERVVFTNYENKFRYVRAFDLHFDDDDTEVALVNEFPGPCLGVKVEEKML